MIFATVSAITYLAFTADLNPDTLQAAWAKLGSPGMSWEEWKTISPSWKMEFPPGYESYNSFGILMMFWSLRIFLEGFGGPLIPYASQRFFAAKDDRDASLTTGSSLLLFVIRWPLIIGVAVLGLSLGADIPADPEMVFPAVVSQYFPAGLRAVVVSCLIAAAMSTYDSTINAGGAYIVNDIYRRFINPHASEKKLMRLSVISTVGITIVCLMLASFIESINQIWSWISMAFFGGLVVPLILRWYWERFNGWGYTIGTLVGMITAIIQGVATEWPEYASLGIIGLISLLASVFASYATAPTEQEVSTTFFRQTRPLGFWRGARAVTPGSELASIRQEHTMDMISAAIALAGFYFFFLTPMFVVIHELAEAGKYLALTLGCAFLLYFTWYRRLTPEPVR
jgi:Na+/proline symporter